jgi:hypothetical protein
MGDGITGLTYPSRAGSDDGDAVVLESLVGSFPGQPGPNHCGARFRVVRYLGKPSGIDVNSLCRRKPRISGMTTTLHLEWNETFDRGAGSQTQASTYGEGYPLGGNHVELNIGEGQLSEKDRRRRVTPMEANARFCPRLLGCQVPPRTRAPVHWIRKNGIFLRHTRGRLSMREFVCRRDGSPYLPE